ncbi:hypothetical protein RchiOBHm_Chr2g0130661 [Rosa chinensis]|uniref:Uncharacterized protein n=3 Tax=Rosa chinensis TaxID=74649 RepID=A0A2P6RUU6_ROSCH|nr:hypothetical protein RchiOBHm_Chr2g0130661 [Rosa chinensis]
MKNWELTEKKMGIPNPEAIKQFQLTMEEVDELLKNTFELLLLQKEGKSKYMCQMKGPHSQAS